MIGDYTQTDLGTLALDLAGADPEAGYGQLQVTGAVAVAGSLSLTLDGVTGFRGQYVLIDNDGSDAIAGTFPALPEDASVLLLGEPHRLSYAGGSGNDLTLRFPLAVTIGDVSQAEGDTGTTVFSFPVSLPRPLNFPLSVNFETRDAIAECLPTIWRQAGRWTSLPGETQKFATVAVNGDYAAAAAETFLVQIASSAASLEDGAARRPSGRSKTMTTSCWRPKDASCSPRPRISWKAAAPKRLPLRMNCSSIQARPACSPSSTSRRRSGARSSASTFRTGEVLGEYNTAPGEYEYGEGSPESTTNYMGHNPSRTTVDLFGNVWVANRDEFSEVDGEEMGSVTRIGVVVGGTPGRKVDANGDDWAGGEVWFFEPDPEGQYLKGPFLYSTAADRDGDGLIKTSRGLGDISPWTNAGRADSLGGVSTAEDELVINYVRTAGAGTRTVAVDGNNDVWVGGHRDYDHEKISGETGLPVPGTRFNLGVAATAAWLTATACFGRPARGQASSASFPTQILRPPGSVRSWGTRPVTTAWPGTRVPAISGIRATAARCTNWIPTARSSIPIRIRPRLFSARRDGRRQRPRLDGRGAAHGGQQRATGLASGSRPHQPGRHISVGLVGGLYGITGAAVDVDGKISGSRERQ